MARRVGHVSRCRIRPPNGALAAMIFDSFSAFARHSGGQVRCGHLRQVMHCRSIFGLLASCPPQHPLKQFRRRQGESASRRNCMTVDRAKYSTATPCRTFNFTDALGVGIRAVRLAA